MTVPLLRYTAARFALLAGCFALLTVIGIRGLAALVAALLLSALLSAVLLKRQRDAVAASMVERKQARDSAMRRLREDDSG